MERIVRYEADGSVRLTNGAQTLTIPANAPDKDAQIVGFFPPDAPTVPDKISDRQLFQQLAIMGKITEQEALDAVGPGILPTSMTTLINMLPPEQQFSTKILLTGATTFERNHPLTPVFGAMYGLDDAALDLLWTEGGAL